jgi:hypothetical protein
MTRRGVRCDVQGYNHRVGSGWKIVTDASVGGGYELVSPPLSGSTGIAQLRVACEALDAAGARVNRACGLHIHHDVSDLDAPQFGRLFRAWSNNQRNIDGLVAPSRRRTQWARPIDAHNLAAIESAARPTSPGAASRWQPKTVATMKRINLIFPDGSIVSGASFAELEEALRATQWHTFKTRRDFRREMRRRASLWTGRPVKPVIYQTPKAFIYHLVNSGLCMIEVTNTHQEQS